MSLINSYKNYPVAGRFGSGCYTYNCVLDTDETGIIKIEIFANSVEEAVVIAEAQFEVVCDWSYVSQDVVSLILAPYSSGTCLLYV